MSYKINSPVVIKNGGPVNLAFINTNTSHEWNFNTDSLDTLNINNTNSIFPYVAINSFGQITLSQDLNITSGLKFKKGGNTLTLDANPVTDTYSLIYPPTAPTINQVLSFTGSTGTWTNLIQTIKNTILVTQNPNPSDFSSILAAVNSIPTIGPDKPTDINRYAIIVYPGVYLESSTIILPSYVFIVGVSMEAVRVEPLTSGYNLFQLGQRTGIAFITIRNVAIPNVGIYFNDVGDYSSIHKVEFESCPQGILADSLTQESLVYLEFVSFTDSNIYSLKCTDNASGNNLVVSIENYFTFGHSDNNIIVDGSNTELLVQTTVFQDGDSLGNGITIINGAKLSIRGIYVEQFNTAINVPIGGGGSPLIIISGSFFENCVTNLNIINATASGNFVGYTEYTKTIINPSNSFFIANQNLNTVTVAKKGGNFTSISSAIAAITTASFLNRYDIIVGPGIFDENPLIMKPFVNISGMSPQITIIRALNPAASLLTGAVNTSIKNFSLTTGIQFPNPPVSGGRLLDYHGSSTVGQFVVNTIGIDSAATLINVDSTNGASQVLLYNIFVTNTANFVNGIIINDNPVSHNPVLFEINQVAWSPINSGFFQNFFNISSTSSIINVNGELTNITVGNQFMNGNAVNIQGPIGLTLTNCVLVGFNQGLFVPNTTVTAPNILMTGSLFFNNTKDINIANPNSTGSINCLATTNKVFVNPSSVISSTINGVNGDILLTGKILQGTTVSQSTDVSTQLQRGSNTGTLFQPLIASLGLNVTIQAGSGYLMVGSEPTDFLKYVGWAMQTISIPANTGSWLFIDNNGFLNSSVANPNFNTNIIVGRIKTGNLSTEFIQNVDFDASHSATKLINASQQAFGNIFESGCLGTPGSTGMKINVSSGSYWYGTENYLPSSTSDITMLGYYRDGSGGYVTVSLTSIPLQWDDNSGTLQNLTGAQWAKPTIFVVGDGIEQKYLFVYGQQTFASQILAETGPIPTDPMFFAGNIVSVIAVVINGADITLTADRIFDIRPTLAFKASSSTTTSDHNSLLNLTVGDAHPQYFRTDGTRTMTGNILVGNNSISNTNQITFIDTTTMNTIAMQPPIGLPSSYILTLPPTSGNLNQILISGGAGITLWSNSTGLGTSASIPNTLMSRDGTGSSHLITLFLDDGTGRSLNLMVPVLVADYLLKFPNNVGSSSQILITSDGVGTLNWISALSSNTSNSIVRRDSFGNFSSNIITANLNGNASTSNTAINFSGSLSGDVSGTQSSTVVNFVGGSSATDINSATILANNATDINTSNQIVRRDSFGNFSASTITASLNGNASTSTTSINFTGSLSGDVSGTQSSTVVDFVGGSSAVNVNSATILANNATDANMANQIVKRDAFGNFSSNLITANLNGNATNFTGSLSGDVTGTQSSTVVDFVGGSSAFNVNSATILSNNATSSNISNQIVKRDAFGNFSANIISSSLNGNATSATSAINFTGSLSGDVTGTQSSTTVNFVGGSSAFNVNSATILANNATNSNTPNQIVKRDASGNFSANIITASLNGNASTSTNFSGSLSGDVSGTQSSTVVDFVGGSSSSNINSATILANNATSANTANQIVKRDISGNFSANIITASLNGNASTSTNFTGSLSGDVIGTQSATVVSNVGGSSASNVNSATILANNATSANTANQIVKRDASGNFSSNIITASLNGNASTSTTSTNFTGSLSGDVTGTQSATSVSSVGGSTASNINSATILANNATSANTANQIVKRDASGNFSASTITATLNGNASTSTNFTGSLSGDVTGTQSSTIVSSVGGSSASSVNSATILANNATSANTANQIVKRDASGNFSASTITATLNGNATTSTTSTNFTGSLSGDVTGTQSATVVSSVGGSTASNVNSATILANNATSANTANQIVKRDASGNFSAGTITATLNGNATNVSGTVAVSNGGTGTTSLTSGNVLVGNGTSAVLTTKAAPSGNFVGTTDVQSLTNKTLTGTTNAIDANNLRNGSTWVVSMSGSAPSSGQVLTATSATSASWSTPNPQTETIDYIPSLIGIVTGSGNTSAATANLTGAVYTLIQPVSFSKLVFRTTGGTSGTSTMLFAIYQKTGGVSGTMTLITSGTILTATNNANFTINFGSTFTLSPGICAILYSQTVGTGVTVSGYTPGTINLLNSNLVAGTYPTQFTTALTPPQATFNPQSQGTAATGTVGAIVRLLA